MEQSYLEKYQYCICSPPLLLFSKKKKKKKKKLLLFSLWFPRTFVSLDFQGFPRPRLLRDWSLITGRGSTKREGGGQVPPLQKGGGGEKVLAVLKGGGAKEVLG